MPVLLLAPPPELSTARLVAQRLKADGGEVRAYLQEDDHELRDIGVKIAAARLDNPEVLEAALTNVHTFIPLLPDPFRMQRPDRWEWIETIGKAAAAAAGASHIEQVILPLPALAIRPEAPEAISRAYGAVAESFRASGKPLAELECATRIDAGLLEPDPDGDPISITDPLAFADMLARVDDREGVSGRWSFSTDLVSVSMAAQDDELRELLGRAEDVVDEAGPHFT